MITTLTALNPNAIIIITTTIIIIIIILFFLFIFLLLLLLLLCVVVVYTWGESAQFTAWEYELLQRLVGRGQHAVNDVYNTIICQHISVD